jgi:DNA-binding NarL/FixJ family response regulator
MRVLIADRNARLLESISRTFAHQLNIHTASTRRRCGDLLREGNFDLAIVSEKLGDGPGLPVLGEIARSSPDTLRIFAARQSQLQLLRRSLGPFGLFSTLRYPIDARKLLSALRLARAALEPDAPEPRTRHVVINKPATITSVTRVQPSQLSRPPRRATPARHATRPYLPQRSEAFQRALARREAAKKAASSQIVARSSNWVRETAVRSTHTPKSAGATPKRATALLVATMVVVFLVSALAIRLFDTAAARSSSTQDTRIASASFSVPAVQTQQPYVSTPPQNPAPVLTRRPAAPVQSALANATPKPDSATAGIAAQDSQITADNTPIADPSTFGSEAAEIIYP